MRSTDTSTGEYNANGWIESFQHFDCGESGSVNHGLTPNEIPIKVATPKLVESFSKIIVFMKSLIGILKRTQRVAYSIQEEPYWYLKENAKGSLQLISHLSFCCCVNFPGETAASLGPDRHTIVAHDARSD